MQRTIFVDKAANTLTVMAEASKITALQNFLDSKGITPKNAESSEAGNTGEFVTYNFSEVNAARQADQAGFAKIEKELGISFNGAGRALAT